MLNHTESGILRKKKIVVSRAVVFNLNVFDLKTDLSNAGVNDLVTLDSFSEPSPPVPRRDQLIVGRS